MINKKNTLIALFSYNKSSELRVTLESLLHHMQGFRVIVYDDCSTRSETIKILNEYKSRIEIIRNDEFSLKGRCGNLYKNMQRAYEYALSQKYQYLFFMQDDIQIVRSVTEEILEEYGNIFSKSDRVIQIDPRFIREDCYTEYDPFIKGYLFNSKDPRRGFADVGIIHLSRMEQEKWAFLEGEPANKLQAANKGLIRVFPFSPIMMHVPFPSLYRNKKRASFNFRITGRGKFKYHDIDLVQMAALDNRNPMNPPYPRDVLVIKGAGILRFLYPIVSEKTVYGGTPFFKMIKKKILSFARFFI